jgi:acetylornithine/succinyldiaminopimelate/putrescine aminotransferase
MLPGAFFCPEPTKEALDGIFEHQTAHHETCAIMLEPIQGEGGVIPIDYEFLKYCREVCDEHGIMLIYDEVQCGVARSGHFWGYQSLIPEGGCVDEVTGRPCTDEGPMESCITPDIIAFAKGIGSGYPIGGIASKKSYFNQMTKNALGSTYGGNVVCCAAANATLDVLFGDNLMQNSKRMGDYLHDKLVNLREQGFGSGGSLIKDIRYKGLLMGIDIDKKIPVGSIVKKASEEQNLIMHTCGKNSIRVIPALNIGEREMDEFVMKLTTILIELERDGANVGIAATM